MEEIRKIIHIDMDAFYASIEQRDNKNLKGKPVIVGGDPHSRGVVATCSYEARKYGIHSAMPSNVAYKRCPYAHFIWPRFDVYHKVSKQIRDIFYRYTDLVEPLSLDEAYLDVTNGLKVITPEEKQQFLDMLPINKFHGIGKVTERKLRNLGVNNGYDLRQLSIDKLESIFKNRGYMFYQLARGIDDREVEPYRERKSVGSETTLSSNLDIDDEEVLDILSEICEDVSNRLQYSNKVGKTITLKVKYDDFTKITRSFSLEHPIYKAVDIRTSVYNLVKNLEKNKGKIRLLGVTVSNLSETEEEFKNITISEYLDNIKETTK